MAYVPANDTGDSPTLTFLHDSTSNPADNWYGVDFDEGTSGWGPIRWKSVERSWSPTRGGFNGIEVGVSHWLLALLLLLAPALRVNRIRKFRRGRRLGLCPACGYDLRATPDRCPECGHAADRPGIVLE
jgi:hypothetical protein